MKCFICKSEKNTLLIKVNKRPDCEVDYGIDEKRYYRELRQCKNCSIVFNEHKNLISKNFYSGFYNKSIEIDAIENRFKRIINFPYSKSDNKQRVKRIIDFLYRNDYDISNNSLLDVGTGTGVFLHEIIKFGIKASCIDPDPKAIKHIRKNIKVKNAFLGEFDKIDSTQQYDIITFNKVLEHITNPIKQLKKARSILKENGLIYIELPDSTNTLDNKQFLKRAEFNVEHYTVFNLKSLLFLIEKSNLSLLKIDRLIDPSGKHTIFAFVRK